MRNAALVQRSNHKVFISHHDEDRDYKKRFIQMMGDLVSDVSVVEGDIDGAGQATETIRREIRDGHIRRASVTIVLIGPCTWQRMHVDAEIHASIRQTAYNRRCGLLGIFLPDHPDCGAETYEERLIPARLADNADGDDPYAVLYDWPTKKPGRRETVYEWIDLAFQRRTGRPPNNGRRLLEGNLSGRCGDGWK